MRADRTSARSTARTQTLSATRIASSLVGIYAGLLGAAHGYFETLQGAVAPDGIMINALGAPCQPEAVSHACWPAMTLIPNLQASGILAIVVSLAVMIQAAFFIAQEHQRPALFILAIVLLGVGGGFLPPIYAMIAAATATQILSKRAWWRARLKGGLLRLLAALWPWLLVVYLAWIAIQTLFSQALNTFLLGVGPVMIPLELAVLVLSMISAFAFDIQRTTEGGKR